MMIHNLVAGYSMLFTSIVTLALGVFVWLKNKKLALNRVFLLMSFSVAGWSFCIFLQLGVFLNNKEIAYFFTRFANFFAQFIAISWLHFVFVLLNKAKEKKNFLIAGYIISSSLALAVLFTNWFVSGIYSIAGIENYAKGTPLFHLHMLIFSIFVSYGLWELFMAYKTSSGLKRSQIRYVIAAALVSFPAGLTTYPPVFGISLYPIGVYFTWLYIPITAYAIAKYRLMDIQVVFSRTLAVALLGLGAIGFHSIFVWFLQPWIGYGLASTSSLVIIGYILFGTPLRTKILTWTNSVFLKGKYDYQVILKEASHAVATILDLDDLLNYLIDVIRKSLGVSRVALLMRAESGIYVVRCGFGINSEVLYSYQIRNGVLDWMKTKKEIFIKEEQQMAFSPEEFSRIYKDMANIGTEVAVPLFYKDELEGVLTLDHKASGESYMQSDIDLLEALASQAAVAIKNAQLYEEAIRDSLTGLYHHKYFELRLSEEMQRAKRYGRPLSLLMLDLDHFKEVNDKYGHQAGDEVLKKIAVMLKQGIRKTDILARYGGEEFSIILTETETKGAQTAAERLRLHIHDTVFMAEKIRADISQKDFSPEQGKHITLTLSIGIGSFDGADREFTPEELISHADRALYRAKDKGRNRVEAWEG